MLCFALRRRHTHAHTLTGGNLVFLLLRQQEFTLQAVGVKSDSVPKPMIKFISGLVVQYVFCVYVCVCVCAIES